MKEIKLTQGKVALVDDGDFEHISQFNWGAYRDRNTWYAKRDDFSTGKKRTIRLHREVMKVNDTPGILIDHVDRNGLNCQKNNLRHCSKSQNNANRRSAGTSKYLGVSWKKRQKKWESNIRINGTPKHLGCFNEEVDAAKAYDAAAKVHHKEFANLNFK